MVNNCGRTIDAHFPAVAGTVSLSLFPILAANTVIMHNNHQILSELHDLQNQYLMMLF
jgi:hypothetical protein